MNKQRVGIGVVFFLFLFGAGFIFLQNRGEEPENDLAPARSQERITEIEEKDTAFEEVEQADPLECADYYCFEKHYKYIVANASIADAFLDLKVRYDQNAQVRS